jgi:quinol-cytochrome oxidoreductase complex cytochrome b subunit
MSENISPDEKSVPFYPDHITLEAKVAMWFGIGLIIIGIIGLFNPVGLQPPANPMDTPAHVKPEWYFLAMYQLLKYLPKTTGALVPVILAGIVLVWPFFDSKPDKSTKTSRTRFIIITVLMIILIALTIWGEVS